jgi:hypothetical protein
MVSDQTIRNYLRADAALCFACGLPGLVVPGWLAGFLLPGQPSLLGFPMPTVMLELGIALALYAGLLLAMSASPCWPTAPGWLAPLSCSSLSVRPSAFGAASRCSWSRPTRR